MVGTEIHVESFCRLATGTGFRVTLGGRVFAVFMHRFGKQDVTPLDGNLPLDDATRAEIVAAVQADLRGYDWQGARE
jgi:hypothetical protein